MRASAVLVGIAHVDGVMSVLLTKRSSALRQHAGEISFPGGRIDPGETAVGAACREAFEEVGIGSDQIDVRGQLRHHRTEVSNSHIVPVVAGIHPVTELVPNPAEVEHSFWVPLAELSAPGRYHSEIWTRNTAVHVLHFFDLPPGTGLGDDEVVWGATARMLVDLLDVWSDEHPRRARIFSARICRSRRSVGGRDRPDRRV